jgi:hypothetical protein
MKPYFKNRSISIFSTFGIQSVYINGIPNVLKSDMDVAWYNKVVCGVEEVYVMFCGILRCFVVLK